MQEMSRSCNNNLIPPTHLWNYKFSSGHIPTEAVQVFVCVHLRVRVCVTGRGRGNGIWRQDDTANAWVWQSEIFWILKCDGMKDCVFVWNGEIEARDGGVEIKMRQFVVWVFQTLITTEAALIWPSQQLCASYWHYLISCVSSCLCVGR